MILCVGELLADMIGTTVRGTFCYERRAGGAPFNVACAARKLGAESAFVGCVGEDAIGAFLADYAAARGLSGLCVTRSGQYNTTLAFVELDERGERSFSFYRKHTADYHLPEIPDDLFARADTVHIGSLMLSEEAGKGYAYRLADRAHAAGKRVSFDVNFRDDVFPDRASAVAAYRDMLVRADLIKFSEEELAVFGESFVQTELADRLVCVSLGARGSRWRFRGNEGGAQSIRVRPVDTTGAGDAFWAGVLAQTDCVPFSAFTERFLNEALRFANACGALNTLGRGAIDALPDRAAVQAALKNQKS